MSSHQNFCILPFIHTAVEANGDVKACCLAPPFRNEQGQPLNLNEISLNEAVNSKDYVEFQESFQKGVKHRYCQQCWNDESDGTYSNRLKFSDQYSDLIKNRETQGKAYERDFRYLEIKAGVLCNLKCRICGPHNSSKLALEESERLQEPKYLNSIEQGKWVKNLQIWKDFSNYNLETVHIMGGEPFLDRNHLPMLDDWIQTGRSKNIQLMYNTNGTVYSQEHIDRFPHFHSVELNVSVDDIGTRFEYQRHPAKWETLSQNILRFGSLDMRNLTVHIDVCWSLLNIFYIDEILLYFETHWAQLPRVNKDSLSIGRHFYIGTTYCPKKLTLAQRRPFLDKLTSLANNKDRYNDLFKCLIEHLSGGEPIERNYIEKILLIDKIRQQSFSKTFPEISFVLEKHEAL